MGAGLIYGSRLPTSGALHGPQEAGFFSQAMPFLRSVRPFASGFRRFASVTRTLNSRVGRPQQSSFPRCFAEKGVWA
jgi:hypothetical protein